MLLVEKMALPSLIKLKSSATDVVINMGYTR